MRARVPKTSCSSRVRDGCVVDTAPLSGLIRQYVTRYEASSREPALVDRLGRVNGGGRGPRAAGGKFAAGSSRGSVSAIEALHERTVEIAARVPAAGLQPVQPATIRKVMNATYRTTELRIADMLVTAIERPDAFHDGTLTVRPNPQADPRTRLSCCGGSLTGA